ncbi:MAG: hypothetical protein GF364_22415 [Candidatus Lokiarchaeota archaeon]|nr:hypothetical protein [Candidatus Lokiarchaeota archaeon]
MSKNPNTKKHLITFLLDHVSPEAFFQLIDEGIAPHVSKYILGDKIPETKAYSNATISRNIITGFPSTSANTHTSILTGSFGGKNNLGLGAYWNLLEDKPKFIKTDSIGLFSIKKFNVEYVNNYCKTLFEYIPDSASYHVLNRGAKYKEFTTKSLIFTYLPLLIKMKRKDEPGRVSPISRPELWKDLFRKNIGSLLRRIQESHMPRAIYIVFLLTDENGHRYGFDSPEYKEAVKIVDLFVEGLVEGVQINKKRKTAGLKDLGLLDSIVWNFHTDHAGRKINRDKFVMVNRLLEVELGLNFIQGDEDKEAQKKMKKEIKDLSNINAFTCVNSELYNGWFCSDIDKIGSNDQKGSIDYIKFYGEATFRNLIPKNDEITEKDEKTDIIAHLTKQDYTQFVLIPEESALLTRTDFISDKERVEKRIPRNYIIKIFGSVGSGVVSRKIINDKTHYSWNIVEGQDPLDYNELDIEYKKFYSQHKWLELTYQHRLPDVFHRLFGFFDCKYAPNFVLTSDFNYHFFNQYDRLEEMMLKVQSHDGLYKVESKVPVTFAGPGIKKGAIIDYGRNVDVLPTLLEIMGINFNKDRLDGEILDDVSSADSF